MRALRLVLLPAPAVRAYLLPERWPEVSYTDLRDFYPEYTEEAEGYLYLDDHLREALLDAAHGAFRVTAVLSTDISIASK